MKGTATIDTWEEGAQEAGTRIWDSFQYRSPLSDAACLDVIRQNIDWLADYDTTELLPSDGFARIGSFALMGVQRHTASAAVAGALIWDIQEMAARKHHDYGKGNIERFGLQGILVRLSDKVERLKNLLGREDSPSISESVLDSWTDLVGYSIVGIMFLQGTFGLPLAADVQPEVAGVPSYVTTVTNEANTVSGNFLVECQPDCVQCEGAAAEASSLLKGMDPFPTPIYIEDGRAYVHSDVGTWGELLWGVGMYSTNTTLGEVFFGE